MIVLISGANNSGKSAFAEKWVRGTRGRRYYIATMVPQTEENCLRIEKHRRQRAGLGFTTLEMPFDVAKAPVTPDSVVLLEDISNLLANNMFDRGAGVDTVYQDLLALAERCRVLLLVTITGMQADNYAGETAEYVMALNDLNGRLFTAADTVVTLRDGEPAYQKGEPG